MLESEFVFDREADKGSTYGLTLKKCNNWQQTSKRVLIVLQTVSTEDLTSAELLSGRTSRSSLINAQKFALKHARTYDSSLGGYAHAVVNFNNRKSLHLKGYKRAEAEQQFAKRVRALIKKLNPTHVLMSGDEAMHAVFPEVEFPQYKRGWVHNLKFGERNIKVTSTLDFMHLIDNVGKHANLLGFWCRHLSNLYLGRNPHDLSKVVAKPVFIKTIEQFDSMMRLLRRSEIVATDSETKNLAVHGNPIYTAQFASDLKPNIGFVLSVDHPMTHWTPEQRKYIKTRLRKFLGAQQGPNLVTFNGAFDLRVFRQNLKMPIIWHRVWEVMYGEHALDENYTQLGRVTFMRDQQTGKKSGFGGLRAIYASYGNLAYFGGGFKKEDRATTGKVDPSNPDFLLYAATDVVSLLHIRTQQIARAQHERIAGKNFAPYFKRHMIHQMSDTVHQISHMQQDGSLLDRKYLKSLLQPDSPLRRELSRARDELKIHREVKAANDELLSASGFKAKSLSAMLLKRTKTADAAQQATNRWIFSWNKSAHKQKLFFEILGLEAVSQTKTGTDAIDKKFIAHYKDRNKIVSLYGEYQALFKLLSTYVKGWHRKMLNDPDSAYDDHMRPSYYPIDTGRLASRGPNLQQIPSRGKLAKIIKRMFPALKGYLLVRYDYSAHEVRVWSIASGDKVLAEAFKAGQALRQAFIQDPSDENRKAIKERGDIHILNVLRFFGKLVTKDDPLRDAVKAVVFGVLYGKGAETLGIDTKQGDMGALKSKISALYEESLTTKDSQRLIEINKQLEALDIQLTALIDEDRTDYAQEIIDKMFTEFKAGARWTEQMQNMAENEYYVYSPIGRIRHLYAAMTQDRKIVARQVRRGSNAPIQGYASEIGAAAGRRIMEDYYKNIKIFKEKLGIEKSDWDLRVFFSRMVHDANYFMVPYDMVIPFMHVLQYQATYGVTAGFKRDFGVNFTVEPEIEMEFAAKDDQPDTKWDWSLPNLMQVLHRAVHTAYEDGNLDGEPSEVMQRILKPYKIKSLRHMLQDEYPLLGVNDLDPVITGAVKEYEKEHCVPA